MSGGREEPIEFDAEDYFEPGEWFRPDPVIVAIGPLRTYAGLLSLLAGGWAFDRSRPDGWSLWASIATALGGVLAARFLWSVATWLASGYLLGPSTLYATGGVFRRWCVDVRRDRIQNIIITKQLRERLVGVGTLGVETAGSPGTELIWRMVRHPERLAALIRSHAAPSRPLVIGVTGSIGGGKSTAARLLSEMGGVLVDSDADARAALDRPEVRASLVGWWGAEILDKEGRVDRKAVGEIVFASAEERGRLERLVHPLVRKSRGELIERATRGGVGFVVADVPLLFEAGVDRECDATVFVDAPRALREDRVKARGWTGTDLARREDAQWGVERKKSLADERVENDGSLDTLRAALRSTLARILARPRKPG